MYDLVPRASPAQTKLPSFRLKAPNLDEAQRPLREVVEFCLGYFGADKVCMCPSTRNRRD